jgi:hypothetical protein
MCLWHFVFWLFIPFSLCSSSWRVILVPQKTTTFSVIISETRFLSEYLRQRVIKSIHCHFILIHCHLLFHPIISFPVKIFSIIVYSAVILEFTTYLANENTEVILVKLAALSGLDSLTSASNPSQELLFNTFLYFHPLLNFASLRV